MGLSRLSASHRFTPSKSAQAGLRSMTCTQLHAPTTAWKMVTGPENTDTPEEIRINGSAPSNVKACGRPLTAPARSITGPAPTTPKSSLITCVRVTGLRQGHHLLEIGCGTGKATLPLARRGFRITCVELSARLAEAARQNLSDFPDVEVVDRIFEHWPLPLDRHFDLAFAATAWHWIDPEVRYRKVWESLRPGGHLAHWGATHVFPVDGDPFFVEVQDVMKRSARGSHQEVLGLDRASSKDYERRSQIRGSSR